MFNQKERNGSINCPNETAEAVDIVTPKTYVQLPEKNTAGVAVDCDHGQPNQSLMSQLGINQLLASQDQDLIQLLNLQEQRDHQYQQIQSSQKEKRLSQDQPKDSFDLNGIDRKYTENSFDLSALAKSSQNIDPKSYLQFSPRKSASSRGNQVKLSSKAGLSSMHLETPDFGLIQQNVNAEGIRHQQSIEGATDQISGQLDRQNLDIPQTESLKTLKYREMAQSAQSMGSKTEESSQLFYGNIKPTFDASTNVQDIQFKSKYQKSSISPENSQQKNELKDVINSQLNGSQNHYKYNQIIPSLAQINLIHSSPGLASIQTGAHTQKSNIGPHQNQRGILNDQNKLNSSLCSTIDVRLDISKQISTEQQTHLKKQVFRGQDDLKRRFIIKNLDNTNATKYLKQASSCQNSSLNSRNSQNAKNRSAKAIQIQDSEQIINLLNNKAKFLQPNKQSSLVGYYSSKKSQQATEEAGSQRHGSQDQVTTQTPQKNNQTDSAPVSHKSTSRLENSKKHNNIYHIVKQLAQSQYMQNLKHSDSKTSNYNSIGKASQFQQEKPYLHIVSNEKQVNDSELQQSDSKQSLVIPNVPDEIVLIANVNRNSAINQQNEMHITSESRFEETQETILLGEEQCQLPAAIQNLAKSKKATGLIKNTKNDKQVAAHIIQTPLESNSNYLIGNSQSIDNPRDSGDPSSLFSPSPNNKTHSVFNKTQIKNQQRQMQQVPNKDYLKFKRDRDGSASGRSMMNAVSHSVFKAIDYIDRPANQTQLKSKAVNANNQAIKTRNGNVNKNMLQLIPQKIVFEQFKTSSNEGQNTIQSSAKLTKHHNSILQTIQQDSLIDLINNNGIDSDQNIQVSVFKEKIRIMRPSEIVGLSTQNLTLPSKQTLAKSATNEDALYLNQNYQHYQLGAKMHKASRGHHLSLLSKSDLQPKKSQSSNLQRRVDRTSQQQYSSMGFSMPQNQPTIRQQVIRAFKKQVQQANYNNAMN